jgi:hypothetical protein
VLTTKCMGFSKYDIDYFANISHRVVMQLTQPAGGYMVTQHLTCMQQKVLYGITIKVKFCGMAGAAISFNKC